MRFDPPARFSAPAYQPVDPTLPQPEPKEKKGHAVVHRVGGSAVFLTAVITATISVILSLGLTLRLQTIGSEYRSSSLELFSTFGTFFGILALFGILITVGLWITYGTAVRRSGSRMTTAGLSMIRVVIVFLLIFFCMVATAALIGLLTVHTFFGDVSDSLDQVFGGALANLKEADVLVTLLGFSLVSGGIVLGVMYFAGLLRTINSVRESIRIGCINDRVSAFVAVINFIAATLLLYGSVRMIQENRILEAFHAISQSVAFITFGICIFQYRDAMRRARTNAVPGRA